MDELEAKRGYLQDAVEEKDEKEERLATNSRCRPDGAIGRLLV